MSDDQKRHAENKTDKKKPELKDLTPEKDPAGGTTGHDLPPGQERKTGGEGGV